MQNFSQHLEKIGNTVFHPMGSYTRKHRQISSRNPVEFRYEGRRNRPEGGLDIYVCNLFWMNTEAGVLKKLSLAKLSRLRYS
jgi:hypothetical protein